MSGKSAELGREIQRLRSVRDRTLEILELNHRNGEINTRVFRDARAGVRKQYDPQIVDLCKKLVALEDRFIPKPVSKGKTKD